MTRLNIPPRPQRRRRRHSSQDSHQHWLTRTAVKIGSLVGRTRNENRRRQVPSMAARSTSFDFQDPSVYQRLRARRAETPKRSGS